MSKLRLIYLLHVIMYYSIDIQCPTTFNSAEFFVKQLSIDKGKEVESQKKVNSMCTMKLYKSTFFIKITRL